jgi:hypothetical protein
MTGAFGAMAGLLKEVETLSDSVSVGTSVQFSLVSGGPFHAFLGPLLFMMRPLFLARETAMIEYGTLAQVPLPEIVKWILGAIF